MPPNRMRQLIIAFWVFIGGMLLWQFYDYNSRMTQQAIDHPEQTKFIFLHTNAPAATASTAALSDKADVVQTKFEVQPNTPTRGSFTCVVTIKNVGHAKATDIQVCVRPYRGTSNFDQDGGHQNVHVLTDDDPISLFNDWVAFPDLAPGESATRTTDFVNRIDAQPGENPNPQIIFDTEKTAQASTPAPSPTPAAPPSGPPQYPAHHSGGM